MVKRFLNSSFYTPNMTLKAVVFDAGDILVTRSEQAFKAFYSTIQKRGWTGSFSDYRRTLGQVIPIIGIGDPNATEKIDKIFSDVRFLPHTVRDFQNAEVKAFWENPHPKALTVLDYIKKKDLRIGILTDSMLPEEEIKQHLKNAELLQYVDEIVSSFTVGAQKPIPKTYETILRKLNVERPEEAVFVGHDYEELEGASKMGMLLIEISKEKTGLTIFHSDKLGDFPEILDTLLGIDIKILRKES